jgi:hypothetical protein
MQANAERIGFGQNKSQKLFQPCINLLPNHRCSAYGS